nr:MAG TPA: hypothetical protein [Caudoviricetes sp.]
MIVLCVFSVETPDQRRDDDHPDQQRDRSHIALLSYICVLTVAL